MTTTNQKYVQAQTFTLAGAGVIAGQNSMTLSTFNGINGVPLTMSNFGIQGFGTCEPGSINEEQISFTGITLNADGTQTLTGVSTVLDVFPYTQTADFAISHVGGTSFVISNTAGFYGTFANKANDETITGTWTFTTATRPLLTVDTDTLVNADLVTYGQLARTAIAGAPNASTSTQGLVQLATQAQYDAKTAIGSTGASLVATPALNRATKYNDYVADTGTANAYVITPAPVITAYAAGQQFTFLVANTNTGASTIAVNGLGTKAIVKNVSVALTGGELVAGAVVSVTYDGTNFQLGTQGGASTANYSAGKSSYALSGGSGTQTITHSLGVLPKLIVLRAYWTATGQTVVSTSDGSYIGTTNGCTYAAHYAAAGQGLVVQDSTYSIFIIDASGTTVIQGSVTSVTASNYVITWVVTGSGTVYFQHQEFA